MTTITTTPTSTDADRDRINAALVDALVVAAMLVRAEPRFPDLSSMDVRRTASSPSGYAITLYAAGCGQEDVAIDTARTVAGLFGPQASMHLSEPVISPDSTWRGLDVTTTVSGHTVTCHTWWAPTTTSTDPT